MQNVFIINGGQRFEKTRGGFNERLTETTKDFFSKKNASVQHTDINMPYEPQKEVDKFKNADIIIYHTPIWWFHLPHKFKEYLDYVLQAGYRNGLWANDGRTTFPTRPEDYGKGGLLHNKKYLLTTSLNAPEKSFSAPDGFFKGQSIDSGIMFGFHRMNAFLGLEAFESLHFFDIEKDSQPESHLSNYKKHLSGLFP